MPEKEGGNPPDSGYRLNRIEEPEHPYLQEQLRRLDQYIQRDGGLQARIQTLRNPQLRHQEFLQMIDGWNQEHAAWRGFYVEREFSANGRVLKIKMDREGNVKLSGHRAR